MKWRLIELETHNAHMNMAIDESIREMIRIGESSPTIRFYRWKPSAVSIGYFQSLEDEVNVETCKRMGIDFVRRETGGGAVYHDNKGEITYSVIAPENMFPKDIIESYKVICDWIIKGLNEIGLQGEFKPVNDIIVAGKKISGNAQTRRGGVLHQHGTILYDLDIRTMFTVLRVTTEKISDKLIKSVEERVTSVNHQKNIKIEELYEALRKAFVEGKDYKVGKLTEKEMDTANQLIELKYSNDEWNYKR